MTPWMRASTCALASGVIFSLRTRRSRLSATVLRPRCTAASLMSTIVTCMTADRADLRDAVAHGAGADDADACNAHVRVPRKVASDTCGLSPKQRAGNFCHDACSKPNNHEETTTHG